MPKKRPTTTEQPKGRGGPSVACAGSFKAFPLVDGGVVICESCGRRFRPQPRYTYLIAENGPAALAPRHGATPPPRR